MREAGSIPDIFAAVTRGGNQGIYEEIAQDVFPQAGHAISYDPARTLDQLFTPPLLRSMRAVQSKVLCVVEVPAARDLATSWYDVLWKYRRLFAGRVKHMLVVDMLWSFTKERTGERLFDTPGSARDINPNCHNPNGPREVISQARISFPEAQIIEVTPETLSSKLREAFAGVLLGKISFPDQPNPRFAY